MSHESRRVAAQNVKAVRSFSLSLPETEEKEAWGDPTFRVRNKIFSMIKRGDGRVSVWCKAEAGAQLVFVEGDPDLYFVPPYVGHKGWIGVRLDAEIDPEELRDRIADSYVLIAPKSLGQRMPGGSSER